MDFFQKELFLNKDSRLLDSTPDKYTQIEHFKQSYQKLNKLNQDYRNKNSQFESDLRQLNKTHNSEYELLRGELKQIRE
jgi:hypothetical protein